MDYNDDLIGIIDEVHSNRDETATYDNNCSSVPLPLSPPLSSEAADVNKHNLIDFDDCQYEHAQSTESHPSSSSLSSSSTMAYEEIASQNVRFVCILKLPVFDFFVDGLVCQVNWINWNVVFMWISSKIYSPKIPI